MSSMRIPPGRRPTATYVPPGWRPGSEADLAERPPVEYRFEEEPPVYEQEPGHYFSRAPRTPELPGLGESLLIWLAFAILYVVVGYGIVVSQHVVVFDALDRLTRAYMVWYNEPPKLAAIGFVFPPITTVALIPFAAIKPLATSGVALPLASGIFAAGALAILNRALALAEMQAAFRYVLLLLLALHPMFGFYAVNGMGEAVYLFFLAAGLYSFLAWFELRSPRYLIGAGMAMSIALLTRYEFIVWGFFITVLVAAVLIRNRASREEVEGSVIVYMTPVFYTLMLWVFFNLVIIGDPFGWLGDAVNPTTTAGAGDSSFDIADVAVHVLEINFFTSPLTVLVLPGLVIAFAAARNFVALAFAALILINWVVVGASAFAGDNLNAIELRDALPAMLAAIFAVAWLFYSLVDARSLVFGLAAAAMALGFPLAWEEMKGYPYQNLEQAFTRAISSGDDQEGKASRGGFRVGIAHEREMANYIKRNVSGKDAILTDNAQTFGVILLTGRPGIFFDRVDHGDSRWRRELDRPGRRTRYFLVARRTEDLIFLRYRNASGGGVQNLQPVRVNERYALLRVTGQPRVPPPRPQQQTGSGSQTGAAPGSTTGTGPGDPGATTGTGTGGPGTTNSGVPTAEPVAPGAPTTQQTTP